ncbi:Dentin sialophosphoprotein-related putative isoform 1 [Tripterygium wilfordii]|uniref:Dentin sialophosphoprotein-related putative isoform 1 n=1 Tax=Tripterygium wilfordii TaxID=458696 RepID=A0A7J7E0M4_TRIWF|nr:dentin sialophosphoprotein isoform X2 [Tripterygium wilfordii]KAF5752093.1 Dentin sialophosphoprotein-related putative isoform 1 [Tripterygium wilfordii]
MYGGSSKVGRGGGRGGGGGMGGAKRTSFPPPPAQRPLSAGRLSLGGSSSNLHSRNPSAGGPTTSAPAVEETFSLVPGNKPPAFAMIIRLVPDLVDEIRRVEAQGGAARIKFDGVNNPSGNVIDVGGKQFRFTWSREVGDLCDIYEERRSGEDGNGLLVESGCAWRKLSVRRVLDESTTNQLKMRSEEAERKQKSRKAIVLDHGNPSMKSQMKQLAAVEANPWRMPFKQKKEAPFKKRKVEPSQVPVAGPSKSSYKSGLASTTAKVRRSASPLSVPLDEQYGVPASPFGSGNISRSRVVVEDLTPIPTKTKENVASSDKEDPAKASNAVKETPERKGNLDLQSMLITLLTENPKGMSFKALEKAVGDKTHNAGRKIDPIIKKIATLQAPGRYFLKPGMEWESFKKPSSESGSSPEDNHQQPVAPLDNHDEAPDQRSAPEAGLAEKVPGCDLEELTQSDSKLQEESNALGSIEIERTSPDMHGEKKVSYSSEEQAGSSSDSGSDTDSDSESSDSGSDSGSHSRSRSPARSGSGSSSDSDGDGDSSSNSKEGSDEVVDIMLSDDEPKNKPQITDPWKTNNGRPVQSGVAGHQDVDGLDAIDNEGHTSYMTYIDRQGLDAVEIDGHGSDAVNVEGPGSDAVDNEQEFADDEQESVMGKSARIVPTREVEIIGEGTKSLSPYNSEPLEHHTLIGSLFDDKEETLRDNLKHEQSDSTERKSKHKRGPDLKHFYDKAGQSKRPKSESFSQTPVSGVREVQVSESPRRLPPNSVNEAPYHCPTAQMGFRADKEQNRNYDLQKGNNQVFPGRFNSDLHHLGQKYHDQSVPLKASDAAALPCKTSRHIQNEDVSVKEKKIPKNRKEGSAGDRNSTPLDSNYWERDEMVGEFKEAAQVSNSQDGSGTAFERYPVSNGRGSKLQREPSELEAGELREPLLEEGVVKRQFERKGSFKQSESRPSTSDNSNYNLSKGKHAGRITLDTRKPSPPNLTAELNKGSEYHIEEPSRSHERMVSTQTRHHSRSDNVELAPQFSMFPDSSAKSRQNEAGKLGNGLEGYGESYKKVSISSLQHESKGGRGPKPAKESTVQKSSVVSDLIDSHKDTIRAEDNRNGQKRRGTSFDEDSSYLKYEKDEPELKGPVKDFAHYKEYIQEYRDKYDSYCSLNSILESYRIEFCKMGKDLESEKGRDIERYHKILEQLIESYRECESRHKRLKKIFIVLHEELKNLKQRIKDYALSYSKD